MLPAHLPRPAPGPWSIAGMRVLLLLLLQQLAHLSCEARIVGVWTDIENHAEIVGNYLANASAIARSAKLRLLSLIHI